ncbi:RNA polymerase sigma-70 factor (ECF subfamily) [Pedobacter cryoconitis]|uniref:RNA polymerase sigma-70 factor (ECF subfamily) n=1 Tax=Pedobacter cryoconitis TaxID=188932 RepID=A0A7X0J1Y7_9SPHI|nr:RNA polymerase sigma-70 factor [Pedobacter cryoconitis]MBB6499581.1 RNA polymerase sigma-70 factor (ECF subfamily) [Pedobacter cryoconitis]
MTHQTKNIVSEQSSDNKINLFRIDEESFLHLYECYWKKLYQLGYKYLGDVYQAEGLIQEVFTSLWQRRDSLLLNEDTIENYLVRAVRFRISRIYSDEVRKVKKMDELQQRQAAKDNNHTEQEVLYRFLREDVDKLVSSLPERCKMVYLLSREKGLNNREIAVNLLISEKTVENQLTKALKVIRKGLEKYPLS